MAVFQSNRFLEGRPMRGPGIGGGNARLGYAFVDIPTTAVAGDTIRLVAIPANSTIVSFKLMATTAVTLNVGDAAVPARFANAQTLAAGAIPADANVATGYGFTYPQVGPGIGNKNIVTANVTASPAAATRVTVFVQFTVQEP